MGQSLVPTRATSRVSSTSSSSVHFMFTVLWVEAGRDHSRGVECRVVRGLMEGPEQGSGLDPFRDINLLRDVA